jgi:hypothetical protein
VRIHFVGRADLPVSLFSRVHPWRTVRSPQPKEADRQVRPNAYAYHLEKVKWAIFGTITFLDDVFTYDTKLAGGEMRRDACRLLICKAASRVGLRPRRLLYYGKSEFGRGKRGHYNFLIGRDGTESVPAGAYAAKMQDMWTGGLKSQGTAVIEPFRADLHKQGIAYQTKHEFDELGNRLNNSEMFSYILEKRIKENAQRN